MVKIRLIDHKHKLVNLELYPGCQIWLSKDDASSTIHQLETFLAELQVAEEEAILEQKLFEAIPPSW